MVEVVQIPQQQFETEFEPCQMEFTCGHTCCGVQGESECLPCLNEECIQNAIDANEASCVLMAGAESELCGICYTSELGEEPCVRTACGHIFHAGCLQMMLSHRWTTTKITFGYLDCPSCKQEIALEYEVPHLSEQLRE